MAKRKTGLARLPQGWEGIIAEEYLAGASDIEVMAKLRITRKFWDILLTDPESVEFREVVEFGRLLSQAWWLTEGRVNLKERQFNSSLWYMNMKNRFGWSEKTESTTKTASDLTSDELDERIKAAMKKFGN
jgi:hypothetical protein